MIMISLASAIIAVIGSMAMEEEINKLNALVSACAEPGSAEKELSPEDFYALMERLNVKKEDFFTLLYEKDPEILKVLDNFMSERSPDKPPEKTQAQPAGSTFEQVSLPEYASLYSDLYVERHADESRLRYRNDKGYLYFTFDDGPSKHTVSILTYLKKYNIPATFFVVPDENSSRFLNMILEDGHEIGIHSASHNYKEIYSSVEAFLADFKKAYDIVYRHTKKKAEIYRFPGGSRNSYNCDIRDEIIAEMTRRGFIFFDWNVDSRDYSGANWTQMYNTVLKEIAENTAIGHRSIILMHDRSGGMNTVLVIEDLIAELLKDPNGYKFGKLDRSVRPIQF